MSLGQIIGGVLPMLREDAEALMVDTVLIESLGDPVTAPDGTVTTPRAEVYSGKGKVGGDRPYESNTDLGGVGVGVSQRYTLHVPALAARLDSGMVVTVTASPNQPHLVGREFRVGGPDERTFQTAQRVFIDANAPSGG